MLLGAPFISPSSVQPHSQALSVAAALGQGLVLGFGSGMLQGDPSGMLLAPAGPSLLWE